MKIIQILTIYVQENLCKNGFKNSCQISDPTGSCIESLPQTHCTDRTMKNIACKLVCLATHMLYLHHAYLMHLLTPCERIVYYLISIVPRTPQDNREHVCRPPPLCTRVLWQIKPNCECATNNENHFFSKLNKHGTWCAIRCALAPHSRQNRGSLWIFISHACITVSSSDLDPDLYYPWYVWYKMK